MEIEHLKIIRILQREAIRVSLAFVKLQILYILVIILFGDTYLCK